MSDRPKRIMIVEDEAIVALDMKHRLKSLGYDVLSVASSGEEAIAEARSAGPDLILMDIMLDGEIDGIEAAGKIKEEMNLPVIYLTAYADENTLERAKVTDPFGYIIKPFEDRELKINIEMAIYKYEMDYKLQANERLLLTTLKSIGDAVITSDAAGRIKFANPMAESMMCLPQEKLLGRTLEEAVVLAGGNGDGRVTGLVARVVATRRSLEMRDGDVVLVTEGGDVPVTLSLSPMKNDKGGIMGTVLVLRDITETKRAEQALRESVDQLKRTLQETVNALAITSEKRDPYTAGHQQRVAQLAVAIAEALDFPEEAQEGIRVASLLHDIGKIYVPAEILAKPARLTSMEMSLMKTHSEVGYDILKRVPFPWPVADIVLQHHERMDGSGYPGGLAGEKIMPEARIIAVADVVEAMSSHRPYRAALGSERALAEISKNRGVLYDDSIVGICLNLFEGGFTFAEIE